MPAGRAGGHKWVARRPLHCFAFASRPCTRERRKSGCPVSVPRWRRDGAVPEGITPTAAPPAALAPRKRGREPPSRPARVRQAARGTGAVRRARHGSKRRNLFDDESDGGSGSEADPQHAAQAEVRAWRTKRSREPDATCSRPAGGPHRQAYGEGPGRKRSSPPSRHSRGQGL